MAVTTSNNTYNKKSDDINPTPWGFKLSTNERFRHFGMFKIMSRLDYTEQEIEVSRLLQKMILEIDEKFSGDRNNFSFLHYRLSAIASIINDPENKIEKYVEKPESVELVFAHLKRLLRKNKEEVWSSTRSYLDHIFWYYLDKENLGSRYPKVTRKKNNKTHHYLVFESHPYMNLSNQDFDFFSKITKDDPSLRIEVLPNTHYFVNSTLYLRFIFDLRDRQLQEDVKKNGYNGAFSC